LDQLPKHQLDPTLREAQAFLRLLDEVSRIQQDLLDETEALRARVQELESRGEAADEHDGSRVRDQEGRLP